MNKLIIPNRINVGFQNRNGTYTGKLAYIIYYDDKGKLRKEGSWNSWRDNNIPNQEYDNEPTSGFVLNKKVGDYRSRFGGRQAYIRIYDPRGFEFEISVNNLIFILEECSSIKGKGIEGEFVYSWDGKDLVLLPISSIEYTESTNYTNLQKKKISKNDMVEGCIYKTKDCDEVMYLGRHIWYEPGYSTGTINSTPEKLHVFASTKGKLWYHGGEKSKYLTQKGFTNLAEKLTDTPADNFAEEYVNFNKSIYTGKIKDVVFDKVENYNQNKYRRTFITKKNDKYYLARFKNDYKFYYSYNKKYLFSTTKTPIEFDIGKNKFSIKKDFNEDISIDANKLPEIDVYKMFIIPFHGERMEIKV